MRGFKALWRLALNRREERKSRDDRDGQPKERTARTGLPKDKMTSLLDTEPPTHTLQ